MTTKKQVKTYLAKLRRLIARYYLQIKISLGIIGIILLFLILKATLPYFIAGSRFASSIVSGGISLISQSTNDLQGENGRINLLLLGISDKEKAGDELTDTIIFISSDPQTGNTLMLSLPRDIWLASMRAKLNTAYFYGQQKKEGGGLVLAKAAVTEILDQPVDYGLVIDFTGFEEIIDLLGGVTVNVERGFDDNLYPIPGKENDECDGDPEYRCRYESLHFDAGEQVMNGERALKYVRSRYAEGDEGTDYSRSRRQQNLLNAIKNKVFSFNVLVNPFKVIQLIKVFNQNFETDVPENNWGGMAKLFLKMRSGNLKSIVLNGATENEEGYLINPPPNVRLYDGHWVLIPRTGSWDEVQEYIKTLLKEN